ncbi:MAG TPA: metal ABC transporter substrate-binding protein [Actinomycetota bacterium]|nr:metal ABC transporter substrate-binding protein [Actinomycetota bacterium]
MSHRTLKGRLAVVLVAAALLAGCSASAEEDSGRPRAAVTISILADMVRAVAGDAVEVESIVPIGGDPHVYEAKPSDARLVSEADIVFRNGAGLERWLDELIETGTEDQPVITVTEGIQPMIQTAGQYQGDPDPHMWMDPELAKAYVDNIAQGLSELLPEQSEEFEANAARYKEEISNLDREITQLVQTIPEGNRKLVTTHDAFRYFGSRYGLEVIATIWGISTEREPSADEVRTIVDAVRRSGVPTVFVETTINPRLMERVASDAGVEIGTPLYGDSVGAEGSGAENYVGMMLANARSIAEGLGGGAE